MVRYLAVKPQPWPQDRLRRPAATVSGMPPTSRANRAVQREAAAYTTPLFFDVGPQAPGVQIKLTIPTDQDGDFWCEQIFATAWSTGGVEITQVLPATLGVADLRTSQSLTFGNTDPPLEFFRNSPLLGDPLAVVGNTPFPTGIRMTGQLPEPFCFTRQGGIVLTYTSFGAAASPLTHLYVVLVGWKEYAYGDT